MAENLLAALIIAVPFALFFGLLLLWDHWQARGRCQAITARWDRRTAETVARMERRAAETVANIRATAVTEPPVSAVRFTPNPGAREGEWKEPVS